MREQLLPGGNLNPVARVSDTVRRPTGAWTATVHQLLRHLEEKRFDGAPRVLGIDAQDREILSFVDGETDSSGNPAWVWTDAALVEAGRLVRRYHDASRSFKVPADARWQVMVGAPTGGEVICHNDLAPFNAVYREGLPHVLLDWDLAAPGPPMWDIAYAAWRFVPLYSEPSRGWPSEVNERARRLRLLCDSYGLTDRTGLVETIARRIQCALDTLEAWGLAGVPGWVEMLNAGTHGQGMRGDIAYIGEHQEILDRALR